MRTLAGGVLASISFALVISYEASALELPLAGAGAKDKAKPTSVFVGLAMGQDSNVTRSSTNEVDDAVMETKLGVRYQSEAKAKILIGAELTQNSYTDNGEYDSSSTRILADVKGGSNKLKYGIGVNYGQLVDPVDAAIVDLAERTEMSFAPSGVFGLGAIELGLAYTSKGTTYDTVQYQYLDNTDTAFVIDVTYGKNSSPGKFFVHIDSGAVAFDDTTVRSDFDYTKFSGGYRGGKDGEWGVELGVGQATLDVASGSEGATYLKAQYTKLLNGGRSGFDIVYLMDAEAAATAEMKNVTRTVLRYSQAASSKWGWLASMTMEDDEFVNVDNPGTDPATLSLTKIDLGLQMELGSPSKMHGRAYVTVQTESRTGDAAAGDYEKTRFVLGAALIY